MLELQLLAAEVRHSLLARYVDNNCFDTDDCQWHNVSNNCVDNKVDFNRFYFFASSKMILVMCRFLSFV